MYPYLLLRVRFLPTRRAPARLIPMARGIDRGDALLAPDLAWASWDFQPSPWSPGALLVNCPDDPTAPLLAYAPPGVSLCGEDGFAAAGWRSAGWPQLGAFLRRGEPEWTRSVEFDCLFAEIPEDFVGWATAATAAHVERLWAIAGRPTCSERASELAGSLGAELEMTAPGALARIAEESFERPRPLPRRRSARRPASRLLLPGIHRAQALDVAVQGGAILLAYLLYLLVREPWAPRGAQVGVGEALALPLGGFGVWLYGLGHVMVPLAFLAWVYFRRPSSFARVRNTLGLAAALAVSVYLLYAPHPVYAAGPPRSVPSGAIATMPALHLVVALTVAVFGVRLSRSPLARLLWLVYPPLVAWILVSTGSRYPQYTIVLALALLAISLLALRLFGSRLPAILLAAPRGGRRTTV